MKKHSEYDLKARRFNWRGPEIIFGLAYEFIEKKGKLLDLGIGTGLSSVLFSKAGMDIYGLDISSEMLDICAGKKFTTELKRHDLRQFPYPHPDSYFNCVLALSVFLIFKDLKPVFEEVSRLTMPGGIFAFTAEDIKPGQNSEYLLDPIDHSAEPDPATAITLYRHSYKGLVEILSECGFEIKKYIEFLALQNPDRKRDIYYVAYVAQKIG